MKKILFNFIIIALSFVIVLLIINRKNITAGENSVNDYMQKTQELIDSKNLDSAKTYLNLMLSKNNKSELYDSASVILKELKQLDELDINISMKILFAMSDEEYQQFSNKTLKKNYLSHPRLNTYYVNKLYAESENWFKDNKDEHVVAKPGSRKYYESVLRNSFLELGYDIDVYVTGEHNQILILTSSFFDADWFQKFKTGGDMDEWHSLGFSRVEISDGKNFQQSDGW